MVEQHNEGVPKQKKWKKEKKEAREEPRPNHRVNIPTE